MAADRGSGARSRAPRTILAKAKKVKALEGDFKTFKVRQRMKRLAELDGYFGRGHMYVDLGDVKPGELASPIGDGWNELSKMKCPPGALRRFYVVEPQWSYPALYNANDPLQLLTGRGRRSSPAARG